MNKELETLLKLITTMEGDDSVKESEYLTDGSYDDLPESVQKIVVEAEVLIDGNGRPKYELLREMKREGYDVFAGESDSFGWLTGCIQTKKGIVLFG